MQVVYTFICNYPIGKEIALFCLIQGVIPTAKTYTASVWWFSSKLLSRVSLFQGYPFAEVGIIWHFGQRQGEDGNSQRHWGLDDLDCGYAKYVSKYSFNLVSISEITVTPLFFLCLLFFLLYQQILSDTRRWYFPLYMPPIRLHIFMYF